jgi:hypothetical protein
MARNKRVAYQVKVSFLVRIVTTDNIDPEMDPEFNKATHKALKKKLDVQYVADNIDTYNLDEDFPYDPQHDNLT